MQTRNRKRPRPLRSPSITESSNSADDGNQMSSNRQQRTTQTIRTRSSRQTRSNSTNPDTSPNDSMLDQAAKCTPKKYSRDKASRIVNYLRQNVLNSVSKDLMSNRSKANSNADTSGLRSSSGEIDGSLLALRSQGSKEDVISDVDIAKKNAMLGEIGRIEACSDEEKVFLSYEDVQQLTSRGEHDAVQFQRQILLSELPTISPISKVSLRTPQPSTPSLSSAMETVVTSTPIPASVRRSRRMTQDRFFTPKVEKITPTKKKVPVVRLQKLNDTSHVQLASESQQETETHTDTISTKPHLEASTKKLVRDDIPTQPTNCTIDSSNEIDDISNQLDTPRKETRDLNRTPNIFEQMNSFVTELELHKANTSDTNSKPAGLSRTLDEDAEIAKSQPETEVDSDGDSICDDRHTIKELREPNKEEALLINKKGPTVGSVTTFPVVNARKNNNVKHSDHTSTENDNDTYFDNVSAMSGDQSIEQTANRSKVMETDNDERNAGNESEISGSNSTAQKNSTNKDHEKSTQGECNKSSDGEMQSEHSANRSHLKANQLHKEEAAVAPRHGISNVARVDEEADLITAGEVNNEHLIDDERRQTDNQRKSKRSQNSVLFLKRLRTDQKTPQSTKKSRRSNLFGKPLTANEGSSQLLGLKSGQSNKRSKARRNTKDNTEQRRHHHKKNEYEIDLWSSAGVKRTQSSVTELDIILHHLEKCCWNVKEKIEEPMCRRAVAKVGKNLQTELRNMIITSQGSVNVKQKIKKSVDDIDELRSDLLERKRTAALLSAEVKVLESKHNKKNEQLESINKYLLGLRKFYNKQV